MKKRVTGNKQSDYPKRRVLAPQPSFIPSMQLPLNRVISVALHPDEDVTWHWTLLPNGQKYISGYTVIKKVRTARVNRKKDARGNQRGH